MRADEIRYLNPFKQSRHSCLADIPTAFEMELLVRAASMMFNFFVRIVGGVYQSKLILR